MIRPEPKPKTTTPPTATEANGKVGVERHSWNESLERFGWDIFSVVLMAGGLILFSGVLKLSKGSLVDSVVRNLDRLFGYGRFILPLILIAVGLLIALAERSGAAYVNCRVVMLELAFFTLLAAISAFSGDMVEHVRTYQVLPGWWMGLAHPAEYFGPAADRINLSLLTLILAGFDWLGDWNAGRSFGMSEMKQMSARVSNRSEVLLPTIETDAAAPVAEK